MKRNSQDNKIKTLEQENKNLKEEFDYVKTKFEVQKKEFSKRLLKLEIKTGSPK